MPAHSPMYSPYAKPKNRRSCTLVPTAGKLTFVSTLIFARISGSPIPESSRIWGDFRVLFVDITFKFGLFKLERLNHTPGRHNDLAARGSRHGMHRAAHHELDAACEELFSLTRRRNDFDNRSVYHNFEILTGSRLFEIILFRVHT